MGTSSAFGILEPVAFALGLEDVAAMGQPVEGGAGQAFAAQDFGPVLERQIRRHDKTAALVRPGDDVEEELSSGLAGGDLPSSSRISRSSLVSCSRSRKNWRSSRASSRSVISSVTRTKRTFRPCRQAAVPSAVAQSLKTIVLARSGYKAMRRVSGHGEATEFASGSDSCIDHR